MKDQMDVCPLARGVMLPTLNPYPPHYRVACASSILPFPHIHGLALRFAFPSGRRTGLPCSVSVTNAWVRHALSTGSHVAHDKTRKTPCTDSVAVLAQALQHLWLVLLDDVYQAFTWVCHTTYPSPISVVVLTDTSLPRGSDASRLTVGTLSEGPVRVVTFPHIFVGYR
jgi:hypothetical protein